MSTTRPQGQNATPRNRAVLVARWYELTREVLPGMAPTQHWPIALDHCFMRVCLDAAVGAPWHTAVARPAIAHLSDEQLAVAIHVAEAIVADPRELAPFNASSLRGRRAYKSRQQSGPEAVPPRKQRRGRHSGRRDRGEEDSLTRR